MPWKCLKCGYESFDHEGRECPDCGGEMKEAESKDDWLSAKEEQDLGDPNKIKKEDTENDVAL